LIGVLDFAAGKYAAFVWPAYGISALVFAGMAVDSLLRARRWRREAQRREREAAEPPPRSSTGRP
jgi:heme exporter protein D